MRAQSARIFLLCFACWITPALCSQPAAPAAFTISVYPDVVLNDVSNHPIGINLDFLMDDDRYLKPKRSTTAALQAMGVRFLRYPGGNKSDLYLFSRPPYDKSLPTLARTGPDATAGRGKMLRDYKDFKADVLDFDEFMTMCHTIGAEPIVVVAADEYLVNYPVGNLCSTRQQLIDHAAAWVRYANLQKKYHIKYWLIGNESWHKENINSTAEIYAHDVVEFSKAMKAVDPTIHIVPNGNTDEFWHAVLTIAAGQIDELCLSNYPVATKNGYASYRDSEMDLVTPVHTALKAIESYATPVDRLKLKLIVAEYGPFDWSGPWALDNTMGYNLANFEMTGALLLEPKVLFSCFWNTRWIDNEDDARKESVFDALDRHGNFTANGLGLMVWGNYLGDKMVRTTSSLLIRTFASYVPAKKKLYVYLLNKAPQPMAVRVEIVGYRIKRITQAWVMTSTGPEDRNPQWRRISAMENDGLPALPGTSLQVVEYQLE